MNPQPRFFYGWYIVAVGFLSHLTCAFNLSSTLSIFLKPLTEELAISRGAFSMMRTVEMLITAALAPWVGPIVDRHGGRLLISLGALATGIGFVLMSQASSYWQFFALRWTFITIGAVMMCNLVVNVTIARWFVRKRGRAMGIAATGLGIAKVTIPLVTASLFLWVGWRHTWTIFGIATLVILVLPSAILMRRQPEDMGLYPDGALAPYDDTIRPEDKSARAKAALRPDPDVTWTRAEALRTQAFWILVFTFGVSSIGVAGLNLHIYPYVTDAGYQEIVAATVMSTVAFMQGGSAIFWGYLCDRMDIRKVTMLKFLLQAAGISLAIGGGHVIALYLGFFLYGVGMGGGLVLQDLIWAEYFGRLSLGTVRGLAFLALHVFAAAGPPFFGILFDITHSYYVSFSIFTAALLFSAFLILLAKPPRKQS
ncbi:MAG TPA: MFS transporter [Candidatus Acidoferrales bacterium]|nr:MFS transporter [Candidatus Acidoferrales bacterium]